MENKNKLTLVLYPNTHGIGFVICENPKEIVDFGMKSISKRTHFQYLHKAKWLIEYASPHIVLLIDYHGANQKISKRQENILNEIADYATDHNINIKRYSRKQIRHTFSELSHLLNMILQ